MVSEHSYHYLRESSYSAAGGVSFATAGGREANPFFFQGFAGNARQAAQAILAVAEVARTRYFDAGAAQRMRDPVVTSNRSVLRVESFSACNGVYARFDLDEAGFDGEYVDWGTTNIDVNDPLRAALVGVAAGEPLRLSVGSDSVTFDTLGASVIERKVPLPDRWLRGFGEVQVASSAMMPVANLGAAQARSLLRSLPKQKTGNRPTWLQLSRGGVRLSQRPDGSLPSLVGPQRLASLQRMATHVRGMTVYAPTPRLRADGSEVLRPSGWVVDLDYARLTLVISPELYRGFSGEGTVLTSLASADDTSVDAVGRMLDGQAHLDVDSIAADMSGPIPVLGALRMLGASGRVGHDLNSNGFFHRDLPFDRAALNGMHPRLNDARKLVLEGAVNLDGNSATVTSGETHYTVSRSVEGETCSCAWFAKHRGERGPCKHVLATQLAVLEGSDPA